MIKYLKKKLRQMGWLGCQHRWNLDWYWSNQNCPDCGKWLPSYKIVCKGCKSSYGSWKYDGHFQEAKILDLMEEIQSHTCMTCGYRAGWKAEKVA